MAYTQQRVTQLQGERMMGRDDARCKMGSRDRGGRRKWRGKGKGKREMKTTERCGERLERIVKEKEEQERGGGRREEDRGR